MPNVAMLIGAVILFCGGVCAEQQVTTRYPRLAMLPGGTKALRWFCFGMGMLMLAEAFIKRN